MRFAFSDFVKGYGAKYPKVEQCLVKDRDALLTFYNFPAEHWRHIRTCGERQQALWPRVSKPDCLSAVIEKASRFSTEIRETFKFRVLQLIHRCVQFIEEFI
jgi:Transposase, Mutator family